MALEAEFPKLTLPKLPEVQRHYYSLSGLWNSPYTLYNPNSFSHQGRHIFTTFKPLYALLPLPLSKLYLAALTTNR